MKYIFPYWIPKRDKMILLFFFILFVRGSSIGFSPWNFGADYKPEIAFADQSYNSKMIENIIWNHNPNENTGGYFVYYAVSSNVPNTVSQRISNILNQLLLHTCVVFADIAVQERIGSINIILVP